MLEEQIQDQIHLAFVDLTDRQAVNRLFSRWSPDIVVHLAAQSHVGLSFKEPSLTAKINVIGTQNVLDAVRDFAPDASFVFAGSSEEYGLTIVSKDQYARLLHDGKKVIPSPVRIPELPIKEDNPLRPQSPYAITKVYGDMLTRNYADAFGLNSKVIRGFNFEGPGRGPRFVTSTIVIQTLNFLAGKARNIALGNVNAFRDWTHVEDMANAYHAFSLDGYPGDLINFGSMRTNSILTFLLLTLKFVGKVPTRLYTADKSIVIDAPVDGQISEWFGLRFWISNVDQFLLNGGEFTPKHKFIFVETEDGTTVPIYLDPERYRPADVPILLADASKAQKEYKIHANHSLEDIVKDMIAYYQDFAVRNRVL